MKKICLLAITAVLAGCMAAGLVEAPNQTIEPPPADKSQVVFVRSSAAGNEIVGLYDVTGGDIEFIGLSRNRSNVAFTSETGHRVFMVVAGASSIYADFMEADLEEGKTYYSIVTPRGGGVIGVRYSMWPIKRNNRADYHPGLPEFRQWRNQVLMTTTQAARENEANVRPNVVKQYHQHWRDWNRKSDEDLARRTLAPEDGFTPGEL